MSTEALTVARHTQMKALDVGKLFNSEGDIGLLRLSQLTRSKSAPRLTNSDCQQFVFVHSGEGSVSLNGRHFALRAGAALAVPSGTACVLRFDTHGDGLCLRIRDAYFKSRVIPVLPATIESVDRYWDSLYAPVLFNDLVNEANGDRRDGVLRELLAARERIGIGCDPTVVAYMIIVICEPHLRSAIEGPKRGGSRVQPRARFLVLKFRDLIERHFIQHLQLQDYCTLLQVRQRHLSQACQIVTGETPLTLIHDRIVLEAKRRLCSTHEAIAEIASSLGFDDVSYFSRFIRRRTGVNPKSFRA
jgi:AraC family transcriptional activator of pobA